MSIYADLIAALDTGRGEWDEMVRNCDVVVRINSKEEIFVKFTKMYESPSLSFGILKAVSEFFGTDGVEVFDEISELGCDTCDYGSCYGKELRIVGATRNVPTEKEWTNVRKY